MRARGDVEQAIKDFDDLLCDGPANLRATYHYERAQAFVAQANYDKAIADLEATIELIPSAADARHALGMAYFKKGNMDKRWRASTTR